LGPVAKGATKKPAKRSLADSKRSSLVPTGGSGGEGGGGEGSGSGEGAPDVEEEEEEEAPRPQVKVVAVKPRAVSKARAARLVYPSRQRDERDGPVFVVMVNVDRDGDVVGARLVRGVDPHSNEQALDAVWRFRYEPALDDAGKPIASRVEQSFMVE
jgi:TonB family protein